MGVGPRDGGPGMGGVGNLWAKEGAEHVSLSFSGELFKEL